MGFLDHSTNNIVVDAVLTDKGRELLSRNDNSFVVSQFALGDDEIDYQIIEQFGRTVGKEKIEKNTPVLEALTSANLGLNYKLVSINNEYTTHFPLMTISTQSTSNFVFNRNSLLSKNITISVEPVDGSTTIENQLIDSSYRVELNSLFFRVQRETPDILYNDNTVVYEITAGAGQGSVLSTATFNLNVNTNITDNTFNIYSTAGGSYIKSFMKVTGINSGLTSITELRINNR